MITNTPKATDFEAAGNSFLNLAWDHILELYYYLQESQIETWDDDGRVRDEFWEAAQSTVTTALALTHQGADMLIMKRIAKVSPYLLVANRGSDWPTPEQGGCIDFSSFRSHDSQDLPRVHDSIAPEPLPEGFRSTLTVLRKARNRAVHTVDASQRMAPVDVLRLILEVAEVLIGPGLWTKRRWKYLETYPLSVLHSSDHIDYVMCNQITTAVSLLNPAEVRKYFGFPKKQRRYLCTRCENAAESGKFRTALLTPNTAVSNRVECFVCRTKRAVKRRACGQAECKGNVIESHSKRCLTCGK